MFAADPVRLDPRMLARIYPPTALLSMTDLKKNRPGVTKIIETWRPYSVYVDGDVNSTVICLSFDYFFIFFGVMLNLDPLGIDWSWLKWSSTSIFHLQKAEKEMLKYVKTPIHGQYVNIGSVVGEQDCKIWTISLTEKGCDKTPLVLFHGYASGLGLWALNLDQLSASRHVYAFDVLGFGRSSRPTFSSDALAAEKELVDSFERWRKEMKLERFILLGHSLGGFLATSYAIKYPNQVAHLILADPWGFSEKPAHPFLGPPFPFWAKLLAYVIQPVNLLWGLRAAGPIGPKLIQNCRPDLIKKFAVLGDTSVADYLYHCNAQTPTGESAFRVMMNLFAWAKHPMIRRIPNLDKDVSMTMIYGSNSWVDPSPGAVIQQMRSESYVDVQIMEGADHDLYAGKADQFNKIVTKAASYADRSDIHRFLKQESD